MPETLTHVLRSCVGKHTFFIPRHPDFTTEREHFDLGNSRVGNGASRDTPTKTSNVRNSPLHGHDNPGAKKIRQEEGVESSTSVCDS